MRFSRAGAGPNEERADLAALSRDAHLPSVGRPMLVVQGSRDTFGTPDELRPAFESLMPPATLHVIEGGDHSFKVARAGAAGQTAIDTGYSSAPPGRPPNIAQVRPVRLKRGREGEGEVSAGSCAPCFFQNARNWVQ